MSCKTLTKNEITKGLGCSAVSDLSVMIPAQTSSPEFQNWFGDSAIVDESGNAKVVYHGTPNEFCTFDFSHIRDNGTSEGVGFYFTDDRGLAGAYAGEGGAVIESYLSIRKPMTLDQRKITKSQFRRILNEIHKHYEKTGEGAGLTNYGDVEWDGLNTVIAATIDLEFETETDLDLIGSLGNSGAVGYETLNKIVTNITGYDGVVTEWQDGRKIYVAFSPEQIKSVYNQGTFDPKDPSIMK